MMSTEEKIMQEKLENLYQDMLGEIITYMDQKKLTLKDIAEHLPDKIDGLASYFSLEQKSFSVYHELLKIVKEW